MPTIPTNETSSSAFVPPLLETSFAPQYNENNQSNLQSSIAQHGKRKAAEDHHRKATRIRMADSPSSQLCQECAKIRLSKITNIDLNELRTNWYEGIKIADLGTRINAMPGNKCGLCRFFHQNREPGASIEEQYQLRVFAYNAMNKLLDNTNHTQSSKLTDMPFLGIVPLHWQHYSAEAVESIYDSEGCLSQRGSVFCISNTRPTKAFFRPRILSKSPNLRLANRWIEHCITSHASCSVLGEQLLGLKLIDCENKSSSGVEEVVEAPGNADYAALSYVWGNTAGQTSYAQTVSDAINVTKQLGLRYLWVDKYCIPKDNEEEQKRQISKMDLIYGRAYVTLVASAGADANHGLPGVGKRPRDDQPAVSTGKYSLFNSMIHPHKSIPNSIWATRGWTLQEAFLSRRRLVFTENQIYFECRRMNCSETLPHDIKTMERLRLSLNSGIFSGLDVSTGDSKVEQYRQVAAEYCTRELTHIRDAINAFAGISRDFRKNGVKQLWGIAYEKYDNEYPTDDDLEDSLPPPNSAPSDDTCSDNPCSDDTCSDDAFTDHASVDDVSSDQKTSDAVSLDDISKGPPSNHSLLDNEAIDDVSSRNDSKCLGNVTSTSNDKNRSRSSWAGVELRRILMTVTYDNHSDEDSQYGDTDEELLQDDPSDDNCCEMISSLASSLAWYHIGDLIPERCYYFNVDRQVQDNPSSVENTVPIPSWSWLGWYYPTQPKRVAAAIKYDKRETELTECDVQDIAVEFSNSSNPAKVSLRNPQEFAPCLGKLGDGDSFSSPTALYLKGGILKTDDLQYDARGTGGPKYNAKIEPRTILFDGRRMHWDMSSWPGSHSTAKKRMKLLHNSITAGRVELFLLLRQETNYHVFLVTEKLYDSSGNSESSNRIGITTLSCYNLRIHKKIKEGVTIRLV